jgi:hypothetical protein
MDSKKRKHNDTKVSLHPLSFEEAIKELATPFKRKDSQVVASDNTNQGDLEPGPSKKRTSRHQ